MTSLNKTDLFENKQFIFRLRMAAGWGITRNSQQIEYTYKWAIENFDFAMKLGEEKIESGSFSIPGVPGEFHMMIAYVTEGSMSIKRVKVNGQEYFDIKFYFCVTLKSTVEGTKAAGKLEVIKDGADTMTGEFGDPTKNRFVLKHGFRQNFGLKYVSRDESEVPATGFFTSGSTSLLKLVATITIPGKLTSLGGTAVEQNRLFDFQPLLSDPKHSDIVLKCDGMRFQCHKVILASR